MTLNAFTCRQCGQLHELTEMEMVGRRTSPWTRRCTCGARYQLTKTENRLVEWGAGYVGGQLAATKGAPPLPLLTSPMFPLPPLPLLPPPLPLPWQLPPLS